jgi:hypothetical protein
MDQIGEYWSHFTVRITNIHSSGDQGFSPRPLSCTCYFHKDACEGVMVMQYAFYLRRPIRAFVLPRERYPRTLEEQDRTATE